jgi:glutaryl-CoA dehydrogenase
MHATLDAKAKVYKVKQGQHPIMDTDFYNFFSELSADEVAFRQHARIFAESLRPGLAEAWERAELPEGVVDKFRHSDLLTKMHPEKDDATGQYHYPVIDGLLSMELARVDPSLATFCGVQGGLAMGAIKLCGSDEQRREWLPKMRRWDVLGAFGLTEPDVGSGVAGGLTTTCQRDGDTWTLNGRKKWIGNATFADITIIWARDLADSQVKGFIVDTSSPGFTARKMEGKIAQRINQNAEITIDNVRVSESRRLQRANSFADTARVLSATRAGVAWIALGCATGAYEHALAYAKQRQQFGKPIGSFQLVQRMLVTMLGHLTAIHGMVLRVSRMQQAGEVRDEHTSLAKQYCAARCRDIVALARESLGGNGILLEYDVARYFADAEAIYSYEGTNEINTLIVGRALTGVGAFVG